MKAKQYPAIDAMRLLMAFCVVGIHAAPFENISPSLNFWVTDWLFRIAVPFFFIASGFFLFRKMQSKVQWPDVRRYWLRIFRVYFLWMVIYFPIIFYENILPDPGGVFHGLLLVLRGFFLSATVAAMHLWFLRALLVAVPIVAFCLWRRWSFRKLFAIFGGFYIVALLFSNYRPVYYVLVTPESMLANFIALYSNVVAVPPTGLCIGALFVSIGAYIAWRPIPISRKAAVMGLFFSFFAFLGEGYVVHHFSGVVSRDEYIFIPFLSFFLFSILQQMEVRFHAIYIEWRKMSALIFYVHILFVHLVEGMQASHMIPASSLDKFLFVCCFSVLFSRGMIYLSHRPRYHFLEYLF